MQRSPRGRSHSAPPWGGKRCACDGASEVILGITVATGKMRAGEAKDGLDLDSGSPQREQMSGNPKIHDAPIRLRKAFANMPSLHTALIYPVSFRSLGRFGIGRGPLGRHRRGQRLYRLSGEVQQRLAVRREDRTGVDELHPRRETHQCASFGFLVGESREPAQVTPVGAGPIAAVEHRQLSAGRSRKRRLQRSGTEVNPSLQMAGAGLHHHAGLMPIGAHSVHHRRIGTIQIDQNIACILFFGVRLDVNIATLAVAHSKEADGSSTRQLAGCPEPLAWIWPTRWLVNQTDQIKFARHRGQLTPDGLPSQKESTVVHERNCAIEATRRTINSRRTVNAVLKCLNCLSHLRGQVQSSRPICGI